MNVFDLDRALVGDYERFARSFTQIRAPDIRSQVEQIYATNRFWPEPLISINPNFERGASVADLAADGSLHPDTARVFRVDGQPIRFHRHQAQAIAKATQRQSFAVTTGTGSGTRRRRRGANARDRHLPDECAGQQPNEGAGEIHRAIGAAGPIAADLCPL